MNEEKEDDGLDKQASIETVADHMPKSQNNQSGDETSSVPFVVEVPRFGLPSESRLELGLGPGLGGSDDEGLDGSRTHDYSYRIEGQEQQQSTPQIRDAATYDETHQYAPGGMEEEQRSSIGKEEKDEDSTVKETKEINKGTQSGQPSDLLDDENKQKQSEESEISNITKEDIKTGEIGTEEDAKVSESGRQIAQQSAQTPSGSVDQSKQIAPPLHHSKPPRNPNSPQDKAAAAARQSLANAQPKPKPQKKSRFKVQPVDAQSQQGTSEHPLPQQPQHTTELPVVPQPQEGLKPKSRFKLLPAQTQGHQFPAEQPQIQSQHQRNREGSVDQPSMQTPGPQRAGDQSSQEQQPQQSQHVVQQQAQPQQQQYAAEQSFQQQEEHSEQYYSEQGHPIRQYVGDQSQQNYVPQQQPSQPQYTVQSQYSQPQQQNWPNEQQYYRVQYVQGQAPQQEQNATIALPQQPHVTFQAAPPGTHPDHIVGMVGSTPIVKINGTVGHVIKKKKGRFKLLQEAYKVPGAGGGMETQSGPVQGTAGLPSANQSVPSVVVANRERTLSNGSVMSQITNATSARPQAFDSNGVPIVKKKGRFMVTNLKDSVPGSGQPQAVNPEGTESQQPPQQATAHTIGQSSPSQHQRRNSGDQSIHGNQSLSANAVPPSQQQQRAQPQVQARNDDTRSVQQQQGMGNDDTKAIAQNDAPPAIVYTQPQQMMPPTDQSYAPLGASQSLPGDMMQAAQLGQTIQLMYTSQVVAAPPAYANREVQQNYQQQPAQQYPQATQALSYPQQPQQFQQQLPFQSQSQQQQHHVSHYQHAPQQHQSQAMPVAPATPPPSHTVAAAALSQDNYAAPELPIPVSAGPSDTALLKQGSDDPVNSAPKAQKTPNIAASSPVPAQGQPPRNKQRNLVAPRNAAGYGNPVGLGKVFYFLDQMRAEVTDADKTIKTLQKDMKFMREKNKELEARNKELEKRLREEMALREAAQAKLRTSKKKGGASSEAQEENSGVASKKLNKGTASMGKESTTFAVNGKNAVNESAIQGPVVEGAKVRPKQVNDANVKSSSLHVAAPQTTSTGTAAKQNNCQVHTAKPTKVSQGAPLPAATKAGSVPPGAKQFVKIKNNGEKKEKADSQITLQSTHKEIISDSVEATIAEKNLAALEAAKAKPEAAIHAKQLASRQGNGDSLDKKGTSSAATSGNMSTSKNPVPARAQTDDTHKFNSDVSEKEDSAKDLPRNNPIARATSAPVPDMQLDANLTIRRSATSGSKTSSAIEFDPLRAGQQPTEQSFSTDADGRNTPLDSQSVSSTNATGFPNGDIGLGPGDSYMMLNQYSPQQFEGPVTVPLMDIMPPNGLATYPQQPEVNYHQTPATMSVPQHRSSSVISEQQSGGLTSSLSVIQQPNLSVADQQSVHSMPLPGLSQPIILFQAAMQQQHHGRTHMKSAHDFSQSGLMVPNSTRNASLSSLQDLQTTVLTQPNHNRMNSSNTLPDLSSSWSGTQNAQWTVQQPFSIIPASSYQGSSDTPTTTNVPHQQQQTQQRRPQQNLDPFDELLSCHPMSDISNTK